MRLIFNTTNATNTNTTNTASNLDSKSDNDSECDIWSDEFWSIGEDENMGENEEFSDFSIENNSERQLDYANDNGHDLEAHTECFCDYCKKCYYSSPSISSSDESESEYSDESSNTTTVHKVKRTFYDETGCEIDIVEFFKSV